MSAGAESAVVSRLYAAKARRVDLRVAERREREATIAFMDAALAMRMSWEHIGQALGVSGTAARRYYARNRRKVRSV